MSQPQNVQPQLPLLSRLKTGGQAYGVAALFRSMDLVRGWNQALFPTGNEPDITKTYETRRHLPISIFIPKHYKSTLSTAKLPTLYTVHGGGFTVGSPRDDDKWNRQFADTHSILVIALNYSKAPLHPFPTAIHDLEALITSTLSDPILPISPQDLAIAGFSAGGNLALAVSLLPSLKTTFTSLSLPGLRAVIPVYPGLDRTVSRDFKATQRQYKKSLSPSRNSETDLLLVPGKFFDWSYIPVGHDLRDPLLSPIFAKREDLPKWVFLVAVELDMNSHEAWRMACGLVGREVPAMETKSGRVEIGEVGELELVDERFAWEEVDEGQKGGVRWLLIPDAVHAFDHMPPSWLGDEVSVKDAKGKNDKLIKEIGDWLKQKVWVD